jgi:hypothetical protein
LNKLAAAVKHGKKTRADLKQFLDAQDAYTLHTPVREHFQKNSYSVPNLLDVWECDLVDVQSIGKYKNNYKYLLTFIDVFSKYLHIVPLKSKTGPTVTAAFQSIFKNPGIQNLYANVPSGCEQVTDINSATNFENS